MVQAAPHITAPLWNLLSSIIAAVEGDDATKDPGMYLYIGCDASPLTIQMGPPSMFLPITRKTNEGLHPGRRYTEQFSAAVRLAESQDLNE